MLAEHLPSLGDLPEEARNRINHYRLEHGLFVDASSFGYGFMNIDAGACKVIDYCLNRFKGIDKNSLYLGLLSAMELKLEKLEYKTRR